MTDYLGNAYPVLAKRLRKAAFASLPTPVTRHEISTSSGTRAVLVKHDDRTSDIYGGNKVRKLEYIMRRAMNRGANRIATFGAVGSNHALATATHARALGMECTCFLAHQKQTPNIANTLTSHLTLGTELVRWGGSVDRLALYRRYLQNRNVWVIPLGGTCWLGAVGFVNAAFELAAQIDAGESELPDRIYIANGTMGSVAGLALGLALAGLPIDVHAVRVADNRFVRQEFLQRLILKTATLLNRYDASIPVHAADRTRIVWRDGFFAGGYAKVDEATRHAVDIAHSEFGISLESTYTGKAMAALLHDAGDAGSCLFWNTYYSPPHPATDTATVSRDGLPEEFEKYLA